jgi:hypothetical protein
MPDQPEPNAEETQNEDNAENQPHGLIQYPAPPGQTEYGTYQNKNK